MSTPTTASRPRTPMADVYDAAYAGVPNWAIGRPQPPFVYFAESGLIADSVLDVGCGTGELAILLARRGYDVLGDERRDPRSIYGITPAECRERFVGGGGWELMFAYETAFVRRYSRNSAYFVCLWRT